MKLLTAKKGEPHFTSMHFRAMLEAVCGTGSYSANLYEMLEPELAANNIIKIRSGMLIHHGGLYLVEPGTYDEVSYMNGTQGMKRIDLVVARYEKNDETGIEDGEWVVIQGEPAESNPVAPEYIIGNMQEGDLIDDCPVFEIYFDGINVTEVKKLLEVAPSIEKLRNDVAELNGKFSKKRDVTLAGNGEIVLFYSDSECTATSVIAVSGRNKSGGVIHTIAYDGQVGFLFSSPTVVGTEYRVNYKIFN